MSIDRINIHTPSFTLRATNIRGGQLQSLVDALRRSAGAAAPAETAFGGAQAGPGAIQSPAERFASTAPSGDGGQAGGAGPSASGFAPGGADQMRSLDTNAMMRLVMQLLEQLLQAISQMFGQGGASGAADGGQGSGGGGADGAGGPSTCGAGGPSACGAGAGMPAEPPVTPQPADTAPVPPRATPPGRGPAGGQCRTGRSRARPGRRSSIVRRILRQLGKGAAAAAPSLVPGGSAVKAGVGIASGLGRGARPALTPSVGGSFPVPPRPSGPFAPVQPSDASSLAAGGSFEDRLFAFLGGKVRESESELDGAMQQSNGGGGDSRTLAAQKVQQLVQKRSELVESLTNTLKTLHESSMSVNRNIK